MVCARTKALFCKGLLLLGNRLMQLPHSHQVTSPLCRALSLTYAQEQILITFLFLLLSHTLRVNGDGRRRPHHLIFTPHSQLPG